MRTTEQLERIREMVAMVQAEATRPGTNQARGNWNPEGDCCTGSRIAHALGVSSGTYLDGIDEWAARMALTRTHVIAMLQDAGAGHDPMGPERWPRTPSEVWRRLAEISEVPTLPGRDLRWLNLAGTDMSGLDLHGCNLEKANLRSARMEETDLSFAKLEGAVLAQAKLAQANLTGADLTRADLTRADLEGSRLRGARLELTKMAGANLNRTRLDRRTRNRPDRERRI